ncbi:MAG: LppX_LprAFG lipoprotein [Actinomycetota bacterium]|nr:LppX_LprAFG lipoprotein [Actinomycetota bacterium]
MRLVALFAALLMSLIFPLVTSCTGTGELKATLPDGTALLADSAKAMRTVTTTHFTIDVQDKVPTVPLQSADGRLKRDGSAKGTAKVNQGGQLVELEFVILGDTLYLRLPTGPVQKLPLSFAGAVYDPSLILDPDRGVAAVLASGTGATTENREQINGVDSYHLKVNFPAHPLGTLIPGAPQNKTGDVWVAVEGSRLVQAQFPATDGTITVRFSEFDAPVEITPPV